MGLRPRQRILHAVSVVPVGTIQLRFAVQLQTTLPLFKNLVHLFSPSAGGIFKPVNPLQHRQRFAGWVEILEAIHLPQAFKVTPWNVKLNCAALNARQSAELLKCKAFGNYLAHIERKQDEVRIFRCNCVSQPLAGTTNRPGINVQILQRVLAPTHGEPAFYANVPFDHLPRDGRTGIDDVVRASGEDKA